MYVVWAVKPKRVKLRAGVLKIVTVDFESDAGSHSAESDGIPPVDQRKSCRWAGATDAMLVSCY